MWPNGKFEYLHITYFAHIFVCTHWLVFVFTLGMNFFFSFLFSHFLPMKNNVGETFTRLFFFFFVLFFDGREKIYFCMITQKTKNIFFPFTATLQILFGMIADRFWFFFWTEMNLMIQIPWLKVEINRATASNSKISDKKHKTKYFSPFVFHVLFRLLIFFFFFSSLLRFGSEKAGIHVHVVWE